MSDTELKKGAQWKANGEIIDTGDLDKLYYKIERLV